MLVFEKKFVKMRNPYFQAAYKIIFVLPKKLYTERGSDGNGICIIVVDEHKKFEHANKY